MIIPILISVVGLHTQASIAPTWAHTAPIRGTISTIVFAQTAKKVDLNVWVGDKQLADSMAVAGEIRFTAKVVSKDPVTNVEFYVGDDIRDTDSSTPYEFKVDTLNESDGPMKVTFIAYTGEGDQAKKTYTVTVDNGAGKGAAWNVEQGMEMLSVSKWDEAIRFGRVALKAQKDFNPARLLMARAYKGKGVLDQAQKFAEDAVAADSNYFEAVDFLSAIHLEKAFTTFHRGGERTETLATIRGALRRAVESRRRVLDNQLDKLGAATDANRMAVADAAIRAGRYSAAIGALQDNFRKDGGNSALANRIAYAQMRAGRFDDAALTMQENSRMNGVDGFGYGLISIIQTFKGNDQASDDAMKEAILSDPDSLGLQTAQAFIALKRNRMDVLGTLISRLAKDQGQRTEVNYYLATLYNATQRYADASKAFERSVLAEPTNYDMYVQRGNEALSLVASGRLSDSEKQYQYEVARTFFDTALAAKPESAEALTGIAIASAYMNKPQEAANFAMAATQAASGYAPAHFAKAMTDSAMQTELRRRAEAIRSAAPGGNMSPEDRTKVAKMLNDANTFGKSAVDAQNTAMKLDVANLGGRTIPTSVEALNYFIRHFRMPLLVMPK